MAFEKIKPRAGVGVRQYIKSAIFISKHKTARDGYRYVIAIHENITQGIGWKKGTKLDVLIDSDTGQILLEKSDDNSGFTLSASKPRLSLSIRDVLVPEWLQKIECPYEVESYQVKGQGLLIEVEKPKMPVVLRRAGEAIREVV